MNKRIITLLVLACLSLNVNADEIQLQKNHPEQNKLQVFINPKIVAKSGLQDYEEGCLSVPGVYESVTRAEKITVEALDKQGKPFKLEAEGLLSVCIQHEMDHLLGKVFVEYLSPLKRNRIKTKMTKLLRDR